MLFLKTLSAYFLAFFVALPAVAGSSTLVTRPAADSR